MEFRDFLLKDLFVADKGDVDLQQKDVNGKGHYLINSGVDNLGIKGRTDRPAKVFPANTITIDFWGNAYYRDFEYKMATHNHVFSLSGKIIKNREVGLFLAGSMALFPKVFSYSNMATWTKLMEMAIYLPVKEDGTPDCDYMQEYIKKLEQEHIRELEQKRKAELDAYLLATGLSDYELTEDDKQVLEVKPYWKEFLMDDVFNIVKGKRLTKEDQLPGNTLFIGATATNHGQTARIGQNPLFPANTITVSYNGSVGEAFYQEEPYWASDDINVLFLKNHKLNRTIASYLCAVIRKAGKLFFYNQKWNLERMKVTKISLPIDTDGNPSWDYMERYIRATEKLAIAGVVKWKDKAIEITKDFVAC